MAGDDWLLGGEGADMIQGGLGKDTIYGGDGDDAIWASSDLALDKPTNANHIATTNQFSHPQGSGFNWTSGYDNTDSNGMPDGYSDAPRNRLDGDQGNLIDGGTGNDFIAAGTGADYVHGGADNDLVFGMDKGDVLFGDGDNDVIYGDGNDPGGDSVIWTLPENHGNDVIDGGAGMDYLYGQGKDDIIFGGSSDDRIWGDDVEGVLPVAYHGNDFLFGGAGVDRIDGGGGDDYLEGGAGNDIIDGGVGNDTYVFTGAYGTNIVSDSDCSGSGNTICHLKVGAGGTANDALWRVVA